MFSGSLGVFSYEPTFFFAMCKTFSGLPNVGPGERRTCASERHSLIAWMNVGRTKARRPTSHQSHRRRSASA